jgi:signal transduction histidine kinase
MRSVYDCITVRHDLALVALAAAICILACYTALSMLARARAAAGPRRGHWVGAAAIVFGAGVWATHFVAMLAYHAAFPVGYDVVLTGLSIAVAMALSALGFAVELRYRAPTVAGVIIGVAIGAMHYTGTGALIVPAVISWDTGMMAVSLMIAVAASILALNMIAIAHPVARRIAGTALLTIAIAGAHFTGMTAMELVPDPSIAAPTAAMAPGGVAIAVAAITAMLVGFGLSGAIMDQHLARRATLEAERLRAYVAELEGTQRALEATTADLEVALAAASAGSQAKSQFLATMSHELRTPLNGILGFSEMMRSQMFGALGNERYVDYARIIHESGRHLLDIINEILDFSKLDAGHLSLHNDHVDLGQLVETSMRFVEGHAADGGLSFSCEIADDLPILYADRRRVQQVLLNILSNAIKFTPRGGEVRVAVARRGAELAVIIADTGIGMAADDIPKALEPFRQVDNSLSRKYDGAGLGLPLAKRLMETHGGRLDVASRVGGGTTVTLTFPAARCHRPAAAATADAAAA